MKGKKNHNKYGEYGAQCASPYPHKNEHLAGEVQGVVSAAAHLVHELLELVEDLGHHLTQAATLHAPKLHLLKFQKFQDDFKVFLGRERGQKGEGVVCMVVSRLKH